MFFGEYRHTIDAKGRISIPAKMRNQCGELVYVMKGTEGCLSVYDEEGWQQQYEYLRKKHRSGKEARAFMRLLTSGVRDLPFDKMGRINIPQELRNLANITKDCVIIGSGEHMEIWDAATWDRYFEDNIDHFDAYADDDEEDD